MNFNQNHIHQDQISIKELFLKIRVWIDYLKSNLKIILVAGFFGGIIGLLVALIDKPIYKAVLTFAIEEDKGGGGLGGALGLASSFGIDIGSSGGGAFASSNLAELMKSRTIVEKVLLSPLIINNKRTTLAEYYIEVRKLREKWENNKELDLHFLPNINRSNFTFVQDSILKIFHKNLTDKDFLNIIQKDKKVSILYIEFKNENEQFAKLFCENIAKETSKFYIETKSKKARNNVDVLQKQVDSIKQELNRSINGFAIAADNVYNLNPALNKKNIASKKSQVDIQSNTTILTNLVVQLELAKISLRKETPLLQVIDMPTFPLEKEKFSKLRASISGSILSIFLIIIILIIKKITLN